MEWAGPEEAEWAGRNRLGVQATRGTHESGLAARGEHSGRSPGGSRSLAAVLYYRLGDELFIFSNTPLP